MASPSLSPRSSSVHAEDLGELSANPARLSGSFRLFGSFGFFGFPISQPNKRNEPVWSLPTAVACELKDAGFDPYHAHQITLRATRPLFIALSY